MKRFLIFALIPLVFSACIKKRTTSFVSDETLIRTQLAQFENAVKKKDPSLLEDYYARDKLLVFPFKEHFRIDSWDELMSYWKDFLGNNNVTEFTLSSVSVSTLGRWAWVKGFWTLKTETTPPFKKKRRDKILEGRFTTIFENREGAWQVVHEHMSLPEPAQTTP